MRYVRRASRCNRCPLRSSSRVWSELPDSSYRIVVLGEAPGEREAAEGRPFVGPAGGLLTSALGQAGIERFRVGIANVICCRPTKNDLDSAEGREAIACCKSGFLSEMEHWKSAGVRVVVPLGNHAMSALSLDPHISKLRGSVFQLPSSSMIAVPSYHPAFLLRGLQKLIPTFIADLAKGKELSERKYKPPREDFLTHPTLGDLESFRDEAVSGAGTVAVDLETTSLRPDRGVIWVVGLALSGERAISVPFYCKGSKPYWEPHDEIHAVEILRSVLAKCESIYQNALFDVGFLKYHGYKKIQIAHDIMLLHHAIHPELPHDLAYIVSIYGSTPYWKGEVLLRDTTISGLEDDVLRTYNLRDAVVLHQVLGPLLRDLKEAGTERVYYDFSLPLVGVFVDAQLAGVALDKGALQRFRSRLTRKAKNTLAEIHEEFALSPGFEITSGDHLRLLLYGHRAPQFIRAEEELKKYEDPSRKRPLRKNTKKYRELTQTLSVAQHTKPLWQSGRVRLTKGGKFSTDDEALLAIQIAATNRATLVSKFVRPEPRYAQELAEISRLLRFLELYAAFSETEKLRNTYTEFPVGADGRVHPFWKIHGTKTGRLACDRPNMQNVPKEARHVFVPKRNNIFIEGDYSNLELRVLAYLSDDKRSIETFERGGNIHDENTKDMFGINQSSPHWNAARKASKTYIFGRNYGGGLRGIYERVAKQVPELGLTYSRFCEVDNRYREKHPAYVAWAQRTAADALRTRRVANAFGRVRILLGTDEEISREGLNTPIQGTAADIINAATIRIYKDLQRGNLPARIILQVHDALVVECRKEDRKKVLAIMKKYMEMPFTIGAYKNVRFPVDFTSGANWGSMR